VNCAGLPDPERFEVVCDQLSFPSRHRSSGSGRAFGILAVVASAALAAALAFTHASFWSDWMFFWAPQAAVLALLSLMYQPPGPAIVAGTALALSAHLAVFALCAGFPHHGNLAGWLYYYIAMPGAAGGALLAATCFRDWQERHRSLVIARTAAVVAIGIVVGHLFAWALLNYLERA
jgi:hypothetical protein